MDRLQCKACGSYSMLPMELMHDETEEMGILDEEESRFFTCHVCGDNWLSVRNVDAGDCKITFVHQMGFHPLLKRVAHMATPVIMNADTVERWDYFFGDTEVDEDNWRDHLVSRRRILRSICSN